MGSVDSNDNILTKQIKPVSQDDKPPALSIIIDEEENEGDMIFNNKDAIGNTTPNAIDPKFKSFLDDDN